MGTVLGLGSSGNGLGIVIGSVAGGFLVDAFSIPAAFFFGGLVMAGGVPVFLMLTRGIAASERELPAMSRPEPVLAPGPSA